LKQKFLKRKIKLLKLSFKKIRKEIEARAQLFCDLNTLIKDQVLQVKNLKFKFEFS